MTKWLRKAMRLTTCGALGTGAPALLFLGMHALTSGEAAKPGERLAVRKIDFRFVPPDETPVIRDLHKPPPPAPGELPPDGPELSPVPGDDSFHPRERIRIEPAVHTLRPRDGGLGLPGVDADPTPLVRIPPEYPPSGRGEGWVLVQFDVSPAGAVTNATAVDAQPRGMFEKNALRAIGRWRYRPAVVEGRAVERRGVRVMLRFELEKT